MNRGFIVAFILIIIAVALTVGLVLVNSERDTHDYKKVKASVDELNAVLAPLLADLKSLRDDLRTHESEHVKLKEDFSAFKDDTHNKLEADKLELQRIREKGYFQKPQVQRLEVTWVKPLPVEVISRKKVKSKK
jgi:hypothetical protein